MLLQNTRMQMRTPPPFPRHLQQLLELDIETNLWKTFNIDYSACDDGMPKEQLTKKVVSVVDLCSTYLSKGLEDSTSSAQKLRPYYEVARKILRESTTILLKHKLLEEHIDHDLVCSCLERLDQLVANVFIAYEKADFALPPSLTQTVKKGDSPKLIPQLMSSRPASMTLLSCGGIEHYFANFKFNLEKERAEMVFHEMWLRRDRLKKFLDMTPETDKVNWNHRLKESIASLSDPQEVCSVAKILLPIQALEIISSCIENEDLKAKLPYIITSLEYDVLEEVLQSLSGDETSLILINQNLKEALRKTCDLQAWIEREFYTIRQTFVDTLNTFGNSIDMLCKRFRDHIYAHRITKDDLKDIDELLQHILIRHSNIKTLQKLYAGILKDPETIKVLNEIEEAYTEDIARLSQSDAKAPQVKGRIYDIIARNTFLAEGYEDEDEAFECFGLWSLTTAESLRESGLLSSLSDEEFQNKKERLSELNYIALEKLKSANIATIADFKRLRIYNANLLKRYLADKGL